MRDERDAVLGGPLAQRRGLVVDALPHVDPSLRARAVTTGFVSVERISTGMPAARSRATPMPSDRLTRTVSVPSAST